MNLKQIEEYCENKGKEISKIISGEYDESDFEINSSDIEREIFEVCTSYTSTFIFENNFFISEKDKEDLIIIIGSRFNISDRKVKKMSDKQLISYLMKLYVVDFLNNYYDLSLD